MITRYGFWNNKRYNLERMTFKELLAAYFQYYAINVYIGVGLISAVVAFYMVERPLYALAAASVSVVAYPLFWYLLHRFLLHGQFPYKNKFLAKSWKRVHFDHHQDPHDLAVLFGALNMTLPTVFIITAPVGYWFDGIGGAAAAFSGGLLLTCFYEFAHCIQHLSYKPKNKALAVMKKRHLEHHFHHEKGNYGITNFFWDKLFGTYYMKKDNPVKSPTVHNIGYTPEMAQKYPWVAEMTEGLPAEYYRKKPKS